MRRTAAALIAVGAAAISWAPDAGAATRIGAQPALYPAFSTKVTDYVSRCRAGRPLKLTVRAPRSAQVTIDSRKAPHRGSTRASVNRHTGQDTRITIASRLKRATYHVRCLPKDFPRWTSERHGSPQASFYIVTPAEGGKGSPYVVIFDNHGVPIWWKRTGYKPIDAKLLPNGNLAWSEFTGGAFAVRSTPYEERRLNGKLVRKINTVGTVTDSHDLRVMPNGHYLLVSYVIRDTTVDLSQYGGPADATVLDAEAQEVTPGGKLVWSWNSKDHVAVSESTPFMGAIITQPKVLPDGRTGYDLTHINSIEQDGGSVLISLRHVGAILKVSRTTGAIEWKLGGTHTAESLTRVGEPDDSSVFGGQHDARLLPDGTVTMHDNRTGQKVGPRALRYRIDPAARTATKLEEVIDPDAVNALCCGSARRLPGGNWVVSWGYNSLVRELSPKGKVVFGLKFGFDLFSYRAVPLRANELSRRALRAGMDAMHPR